MVIEIIPKTCTWKHEFEYSVNEAPATIRVIDAANPIMVICSVRYSSRFKTLESGRRRFATRTKLRSFQGRRRVPLSRRIL